MRLPTDPPQHPATSHIPEGQPAPPEELVSTLLPVSHTPQSTLTADSDDIHPPQYTPREDGVGSPEDPNEFPKDKKEDAGPPQIITPMIDRTDDSLTRISPGGEIHNPMDDANFYPFEPMFMPPNPGTGLPDYTDVSQHSPASHNTRPAAGQETASGSTTGAQGLPPPAFDDKGGTDLGEFNVSLSDDAGAKMQGDGWDAGAKVLADGRIDIRISPPKHSLSRSASISSLSNLLLQQGQLRGFPSPTQHATQAPVTAPLTHTCTLPRLNVLMQIIGSRGDIQPFLSLALVLASPPYNHRVRVGTHECFRGFVNEVDRMIPQHTSFDKPGSIEFFCIGGDPHELMSFMVKNPGLMPGIEAVRSGEISRRRKGVWELLMGGWSACFDREAPPRGPAEGERKKPFIADVIIANPPGFGHIHCAERLGIPVHLMFTMPWSPTQAFPHPLANIKSPPSSTSSQPTSTSSTFSTSQPGKSTSTTNLQPGTVNFLSYALVEMMTWQGTGDLINRFREKVLGLEPLSSIWAPGTTSRLKIPHTYCWSPSLIPKPGDWGDHVSVSGFWFLDLAKNSGYQPPMELVKFLGIDPVSGTRQRKQGEKPCIYIGFGSIVVEDPQCLTKLVQRAVKLANVQAVISKGWGTIAPSETDYDPDIMYLGNTPHDWLFQHVDAVIHHGGAGTTSAGIRAGKPNVIIPFFGDQMFWGQMVYRAGAGPSPVPYKKSKSSQGDNSGGLGEQELLTAEVLASMILEALSPECLSKAKEMGAAVQKEQGQEVAAVGFVKGVESVGMQCWVEEERRRLFPTSAGNNRVGSFIVRNGKLKGSIFYDSGVKISSLVAVTLIEAGEIDPMSMKVARHIEYETAHEPFEPITGAAGALLGTMGSIMMSVGVDFPKDIYKALKSKEKDNPTTDGGETDSTTTGDGSSTRGLLNTSTDNVSVISQSSSTTDGQQKSSPDKDKPLPSPPASLGLMPGPANADGKKTPTSPGQGYNFPMETLEKALVAGSSIGRIVEAGLKSPMDFTMGVTQGFHNAPKLYGDETVRKAERVTGFQSGLKAAGREFTFGLYDGISGLVSHPYKGAKEEGAKGLIKGIGKGIGGVMLKPSAAFFALPGYTMMGIHKEFKKLSDGEQIEKILKEMRVQEGYRDYEKLSVEEKEEILSAWKGLCKRFVDAETGWKGGLGIVNLAKVKEKQEKENKEKESDPASTASPPPKPDTPASSGTTTLQSFFADWKARKYPLQQKVKSPEDKKRLFKPKPQPKEEIYVHPEDYQYPFPVGQQDFAIGSHGNDTPGYNNAPHQPQHQPHDANQGYTPLDDTEDEELQRVLRISSIEHQKQQSQPASRTGTGLSEDDANEAEMLERAIKASVEEFKLTRRREVERGVGQGGQVLDEEADLLERAMRESLRLQPQQRSQRGGSGGHDDDGHDTEDDEDFKRALEESTRLVKGKARESDYESYIHAFPGDGFQYSSPRSAVLREDSSNTIKPAETAVGAGGGGGAGMIFGGTVPDAYSTQNQNQNQYTPPPPQPQHLPSRPPSLLPSAHPHALSNPFALPEDPIPTHESISSEPLLPTHSEKDGGGDDDQELERALEISRRENEEAERRKRQEEEIVLSYVLKASLEERERERERVGRGG